MELSSNARFDTMNFVNVAGAMFTQSTALVPVLCAQAGPFSATSPPSGAGRELRVCRLVLLQPKEHHILTAPYIARFMLARSLCSQ